MGSWEEVFIVGAIRTPFGAFRGTLRDTPTYHLGAFAIEQVLARCGVGGDEVDQVVMGCAIHAENDDFVAPVMARQSLLKAGLPAGIRSMTIDKACCSSMAATHVAYRDIRYGESDVAIVVGAENFSRCPFIVAPTVRQGQGNRLGHLQLRDPLVKLGYKDFNPVAVDAGEVALEYGVTREQQDEWALLSQRRYAAAREAGRFHDEIAPISVLLDGKETVLEADEFPKPHTTLERLSQLRTVYGSPTVTAGNAPGLNDGAAAMVLMSRRATEKKGIRPLGRIAAVGSVADLPRRITSVPALAIQDLLARNGLRLEEVDLLEINEAYAAMPVTCARILSGGDPALEARLRERLNVNGGAIAIGHPLGASGARITLTLLHELRRRKARRGIAAICGGLAQGDAVLLEAL